MINPAKIVKLKADKDQFVSRHSDFVQFLGQNFSKDTKEGDELTLVYTHRDGVQDSVTVKFTAEDVEFVQFIAQLL